jgi:hypothetical protein
LKARWSVTPMGDEPSDQSPSIASPGLPIQRNAA